MDISDPEIESAIKDFMEVISFGFDKEQSEKLKVCIKYADENGKKALGRPGASVKQYYDLENKIIKNFLNSLKGFSVITGLNIKRHMDFRG